MAKRKVDDKSQRVPADRAEERERQMDNYRRAANLFERETLGRVLQPLGRDDLLHEIGAPPTAAALNRHPLFQDFYPLVLEIRLLGKSVPHLLPRRTPMPDLEQMPFAFPDTAFHELCVQPKVYDPRRPKGRAVIFPYGGMSLVLHDRPCLARGPASVDQRLANGCHLQIHHFPPFVDDVADVCRGYFAEEGSELMRWIESNHCFREAFWSDWAHLPAPRDS